MSSMFTQIVYSNCKLLYICNCYTWIHTLYAWHGLLNVPWQTELRGHGDGSTPQRVEEKKRLKTLILKRLVITHHTHIFMSKLGYCCVFFLVEVAFAWHTHKVIDPLWLISRQGDLIPNRTRARSALALYNAIIFDPIKSHKELPPLSAILLDLVLRPAERPLLACFVCLFAFKAVLECFFHLNS